MPASIANVGVRLAFGQCSSIINFNFGKWMLTNYVIPIEVELKHVKVN